MIKRFLILAAALLCAAAAQAQALSNTQVATLRASILADGALAQKCVPYGDGPYDIAVAYNQPASPAYVVWKTAVSKKAIMSDAAFDWTRVDNLSAGKARIWEQMFSIGDIDCSQANIRAGIDAAWVGTAADLAVRAGVYAQCKRSATRAEKLFAAGAGTDASPGVMSFGGALSVSDVLRACTE